jgi:low affinity Fe/Cu permease
MSFPRLLRAASAWCSTPWAVAASIILVLVWALAGPICHYSDSWQLVLNTVTSIATFVLFFVLLNAQARDMAILVALVKGIAIAHPGVDNKLVALDEQEDCDVQAAHAELAQKAKSE